LWRYFLLSVLLICCAEKRKPGILFALSFFYPTNVLFSAVNNSIAGLIFCEIDGTNSRMLPRK